MLQRAKGSRLLLAGASIIVIAAAIAMTESALAQDGAPPPSGQTAPTPPADQPSDKPGADKPKAIEKVTVTGYRRALRTNIEQKRNANDQVDAINAEEAGKFPDLNLSEALQRIPGVAISRDAGEGRTIAVRGLGPQFTRVRINGIEALATTGGTDAVGGTNRNRQFDFNVFSADLFQNLTVRKTASAEVEEGSLGATVDLATPHPLDLSGFTMAASGQYGYNDLAEKWNPRGAFLVGDTFLDGQFGALFSVAYSERELIEEGASTVRWQNDGSNPPGTGAPSTGAANARFQSESVAAYTLTQLNQAFRPRIPRYDIYQHEQDRLGMTGSLQWQPAKSTKFTLDALYSRFSATRSEIFLEVPVFSTTGAAGIQDVDVLDAEIRGHSLVYGRFDDVDIRSEARFDKLSTTFKQVTLDIDHELTDRINLHALGGWSRSDHKNPIQTTILFDKNNVDGFVYDFRQNDRLPLLTYGATDVTNPATWTISQIRLRPQTALSEYKTVQGGGDWNALDWLTLKLGGDWKQYDFDTTEKRRQSGTSTANIEASIPGSVALTPIANYSQIIHFSGSGLDLPAGTTTTWLIPDLKTAATLFNLYDQSAFPTGILPALGNNSSITEKDSGGYAQADFEVTSMPLRGNVGVRYVKTEQRAIGWGLLAGVPTQITVDREYDDVLPSLNLVLEPAEDFLVRLGMAKVMSRPDLGSLNPGATVSVAGNNRTITGGNPLLDPFRANTADLAFEWYFQDQALLGIAFFYKDVGSFVQTIRETLPNFAANPFGLPDSVATTACGATLGCSAASTWDLSVPVNTPGGELGGFEINYQQPLTFLPAPFDNLGILANYTYVQTEIIYLSSTGAISAIADLTNLSRNTYNGTLYYDDGVLSARVSAVYRSKFLTTIPGRNGNTLEGTASSLNVDFAGSYAITDNLRVTLEGINLTDEANDQYLDPDNRMSFYHHYGRQYFLGMRYTY